jgi:DNA-binding response OmpR family regulator
MMALGILTKHKKVLIVEDDVVLRNALAELFIQEKWKVIESGDGQNLLVTIEDEKPDGIVLDLLLPEQDGMTLLEEIRKVYAEVPVVLLTNLLGSDALRKSAATLQARFFNKSEVELKDIVQAFADMELEKKSEKA